MTSPLTSRYATDKWTTDSLNLKVAFASNLPSARKLQNYGDAFSKSSSIYLLGKPFIVGTNFLLCEIPLNSSLSS